MQASSARAQFNSAAIASCAKCANAQIRHFADCRSSRRVPAKSLEWTKLNAVNLDGAILSSQDLHGANLQFSSLRGAQLVGTILSNADLLGTDLAGVLYAPDNDSGAASLPS